MTRLFTIVFLALALAGSTAIAKDRGAVIDLSVAVDGSCLAQIGGHTIPATPDALAEQLPKLLPNRKAPLHFGPNYEKVPDRCFGPAISALQRLGYGSISFETEQPALGTEYTSPGAAGQ